MQEMRDPQAKDAGGVETQPDTGPPLRADPGPGMVTEGKITTTGSLMLLLHVT